MQTNCGILSFDKLVGRLNGRTNLVSLNTLAKMAQDNKFILYPMKVPSSEIASLKYPFVLHYGNHFETWLSPTDVNPDVPNQDEYYVLSHQFNPDWIISEEESKGVRGGDWAEVLPRLKREHPEIYSNIAAARGQRKGASWGDWTGPPGVYYGYEGEGRRKLYDYYAAAGIPLGRLATSAEQTDFWAAQSRYYKKLAKKKKIHSWTAAGLGAALFMAPYAASSLMGAGAAGAGAPAGGVPGAGGTSYLPGGAGSWPTAWGGIGTKGIPAAGEAAGYGALRSGTIKALDLIPKGVKWAGKNWDKLLGAYALWKSMDIEDPEPPSEPDQEEAKKKSGFKTRAGQMAHDELARILGSEFGEVYPAGEDPYLEALLRRTHEAADKEKDRITKEYNAYGRLYSSEHMEALAQVDENLAQRETDVAAQWAELQRTQEINTRLSAISQALNVDRSIAEEIMGYTGISAEMAAMKYGADVADVNSLRQLLAQSGTILLAGGLNLFG